MSNTNAPKNDMKPTPTAGLRYYDKNRARRMKTQMGNGKQCAGVVEAAGQLFTLDYFEYFICITKHIRLIIIILIEVKRQKKS